MEEGPWRNKFSRRDMVQVGSWLLEKSLFLLWKLAGSCRNAPFKVTFHCPAMVSQKTTCSTGWAYPFRRMNYKNEQNRMVTASRFPPTLPGFFHRLEPSSATSELNSSSQRSVSTTVCPSSMSSTKRRISGSCHTPSISCPCPTNDSNHVSLRQRQHRAAARHLVPLCFNTSCASDRPVRIWLTKRCFRWVSSSLRNKCVLCLFKLKYPCCIYPNLWYLLREFTSYLSNSMQLHKPRNDGTMMALQRAGQVGSRQCRPMAAGTPGGSCSQLPLP